MFGLRLDKVRQLDPLREGENLLLKKYAKTLEEYRLKMEDFEDVYGRETIEKDRAFLEALKAKEEAKTDRGVLLEGILAEHAELSNWFGQDSSVIPLSEYDDRLAHGDLVLEMGEEEKVRILMDVTSSVAQNTLEKKIDRSIDGIKAGKLSKIKYFESGDFKGRLEYVPRVVVGLNPETLREFCDDVLQDKNRQEKNPLQMMLLDEMLHQLTFMYETAKEVRGKDDRAAEEIKKALKLIQDLSIKKESLRDHDYDRKANADWAYKALTS